MQHIVGDESVEDGSTQYEHEHSMAMACQRAPVLLLQLPPAQRLPRSAASPHLMVGCSWASMSPPLSFFSSGTTTPTAPSAAASSRFSSAPTRYGRRRRW